MQLAEIRDLDGPNLFMLEPAIKVEFVLGAGDTIGTLATRLNPHSTNLLDASTQLLTSLHAKYGQPIPRIAMRVMDELSHVTIAFSWSRRSFAIAIATWLSDLATGVVVNNYDATIRQALADDSGSDAPTFVLEKDRSAIAIGITGTNGKTTTTRIIAHLMRGAGYRTGWNSSSGIYIEGEEIEAGDYSGPSGARRILCDPSVQAAVMETARGGILLRGLGYEHNDVSVFTNVSPDHLDLQGVKKIETLAETKAVVCKVTLPRGDVVVNADDPLVLDATQSVSARRTFVSRESDNPQIISHRALGGRTIVATNGVVLVRDGEREIGQLAIADMPVTHQGRALHMLENAMCAIGAALGAGLPISTIRDGLKTFVNDYEHNPGRLNLYTCGAFKVVLDFAHNEAGLKHLLEFGRGELGEGGRLVSIIGTAGDRTDESLFEIGRLAAVGSDIVIAKGTKHYLRGREIDDLMAKYRAGAKAGNVSLYLESESEITALYAAQDLATDGDVIVMMAQEYIPEIEAILRVISS